MEILRYVDKDWHHLCVRDYRIQGTMTNDFNHFKATQASKKISYLQDFLANEVTLPSLEKKIFEHCEVADHVYVGFGEPIFRYKDEAKHGWDFENNVPEGPHYYTDDFINKFSKDLPVTFFGNLISHVPLNRPLYYLNDMFFQSNKIYQEYEVCSRLLAKLEHNFDKKFHWELMCSNDKDIYEMLKQHPVDQQTFSTCHLLGISHWGPDVVRPSNGSSGAETFAREHNIRCSDLIDPSIYNQSYYSCVVETVIPPDNRLSMFSEKEAKPIVTKRPFIIVGTKDHLKSFRELGFKTFSPVIDESYDDEADFYKRRTKILDAMHKLSALDPREVYKELQPVLEHNYNHFLEHQWNKELQQAWYDGVIA